MECVQPADRGFFPLDEELGLLPGKLTPWGHERLVRLCSWMPFEKAVEELGDMVGIEVSKLVGETYTEAAGAAYVEIQAAEVEQLEAKMPQAQGGWEKMQVSADGAMVPLLHGVWAEVRTLVVGEVQAVEKKNGEKEVCTRHLSYFSRKMSAQEFQRQALVEIHRGGIENAQALAAVMDGADWEQGFVDFHCPQAIRILDFAHVAEHLNAVGEFLSGEHTPESQAWLSERTHRLKHDGPAVLLRELSRLQRQHPQTQVIASHLAYLKKRQAQMQYPTFRAQGWPIGSGIVESGNKLVVQARLKGAGMHWADEHVNPMLALRNILCSGRWKEEWPRIELKLRQQARQERILLHQKHHAASAPPQKQQALQDDYVALKLQKLSSTPLSPQPRKNPWRNFKHGKALYQRHLPPKK